MRVRKNRWITKISKRTGESDVAKAVEVLTDRFRTPGETLNALSRQFGVQEILLQPLPFDGGVYEIEGKRVIKINSLASASRRTFTLAHEIGHLILEQSIKCTSSCSTDADLERACNCVAAELLMPVQETKKVAEALGKQSPEKLSPIANHFGVSLQTAAQRLYELHIWNFAIGMWRCESLPTQQWFVGRRPWQTDTPGLSAFDLAIESTAPVRTTEYVSKGTYTEIVALKAFHIGKKFVVAIVATA